MHDTIPEANEATDIPGFCRLTGVSIATVYREIKAGRLKIRKVGRKSIVLAEDRRAWLTALPEGTTTEAA